MAYIMTALCSGILFGFGLIISDMVNPAKILSFLDIAGNWDPSLLLVMTGALVTLSGLQYFIFQRSRPVLESHFHLPKVSQPDKKLLAGAALFGIGWGMVGLCPGPAIVNITTVNNQLWLFLIAMISGMVLCKLLHKT